MSSWLKEGIEVIYISNEGPVNALITSISSSPFEVHVSFVSCYNKNMEKVDGPEED